MNKKKNIKRIILLSIVALVLFILRDSLKEILGEVIHTSPKKIIIISLLSILGCLIEGRIIYEMAQKFQEDFCYRHGVVCAFYSEFIRLITFGSGAGISAIYYLNKKGIETSKGTGMTLVQYIIKKTTISLYGIFCFLFFYDWLDTGIFNYKKYVLLGVIMVVVIVGVLIMITTSKKFSDTLIALGRRIAVNRSTWNVKIDKWEEQIQILQKESRELFTEKSKLFRIFFYYISKMTCWYSIPFVLYYPQKEVTLPVTIVLMALVFMLAGVVPTPSSMGSVEVLAILFFAGFTGREKAVSMVLLFRYATYLLPFAIGGIFSVFNINSNFGKNQNSIDKNR